MLEVVSPLRGALHLKTVRVALGLQAALAIILCFVPLFDVLGFERAFVTTLLAGPLSAAVALVLVRGFADQTEIDLDALVAVALGVLVLSLAPAIAAGLLVELLTQPCSPGQGLGFLLLGGGTSGLFGTALGFLAACTRRWHRRPARLVALFLLGSLALSALRLYREPQIFAYSMPFGYWPGSLYDEDVALSLAFWAHRGLTLLTALSMLALTRACLDPRTGGLRAQGIDRASLLSAIAIGAATVTLSGRGEALGFDVDRASIERALSRRVQLDGLEIHVDPSIKREELEQLIEEHRLRYQQLRGFFGVAPRLITSYVYRDTEQKRALMGASLTQISRPWLYQIHVDGFNVPHRVLKHELAHVFAAELASGPLKAPALLGFLPNMAIIEGTAVAADWPYRTLTVHQWARAMRALGLAPDPRRSLYPLAFWSQASGRAYTVAGSFLRFLIDTRGIERFASLYRENDFVAAYGVTLDALVGEWERFIDQLPLTEAERILAEQRFREPGIFQRACVHATARLEKESLEEIEQGDLELAAERIGRVLRYDPGRVDLLLALARAEARLGRLDRAREIVLRARDARDVTQRARAQAIEALADVEWAAGQRERAAQGYQSVLALHLSEDSDRLQQVRLEALRRPAEIEGALRRYLTEDLPLPRAMVLLAELAHGHPQDVILRYLYGKRLSLIDASEEAVREIQASLDLQLPTPELEREARATLARSLLRAGRFADAAARFDALAESSPSQAGALEAKDWAQRARMQLSRAGIEVDRTPLER